MTRASNEAGFTLVEALIAAAVLAGLAASLAPAVHASVKATTRVQLAAAETEALRTARDTLEHLISGVLWLPPEWEDEAFEGAGQEMRFLTTAGPEHRLTTARMSLTSGFDNRRLVLTLQPLDPSVADPVEVDLLTGLTDARFAYWGTETNSVSPVWRDAWRSRRPPQLIAVEARKPGRERSVPVRLEFATTAEAPILCDFDPVSRSCRGS
ncbi:MAG: prepilin-type N-terminal cleavage/methylation domain-containing protein [Pseudomonadota bacterium]